MHPAIEALKNNQRQLDADGCEVGVSRQALDETLDMLENLRGALAFILAFYDPNQRHLDTEAWKVAERGARHIIGIIEAKGGEAVTRSQ